MGRYGMHKVIFLGQAVSPGVLEGVLAQKGEKPSGGRFEQYRLVLLGESPSWGGVATDNIRAIGDDLARKNNYWEIAHRWMDEREEKLRFREKCMYRGFSLWWFERYHFHMTAIRLLNDVDAVLSVLASNSSSLPVAVIGADQYWSGVVAAAARSKGIPCEVVGLSQADGPAAGAIKAAASVVRRLPVLGLKVLRMAKGGWTLRQYLKRSGQGELGVIVVTHGLSWETVGGPSGSRRYLNVQGGLVVDEMVRRGWPVLALDIMSRPRDGWKNLWRTGSPYVPSEVFAWSFVAVKGEAKRLAAQVKTAMDQVEKPAAGDGASVYNGVHLGDVISKSINPSRLEYILFSLRMVEFYLKVLQKTKPGLVFVTDENGSGRPLVAAARSLGIPCVGIQHGIIHPLHTEYVYPKYSDSGTIPLCDATAVFGQNERDILTGYSVFKESQVAVTGQSRLDLVFRPEPGAAASDHAGDGQARRKVVLFSTGAEPDLPAMPVLAEALSQLGSEVRLVIKLHPSENTELLYAEKCRQYGLKDFVVVKKADLYQLLDSCDLHVSINSTVLSEAVVFGKPNLVIDTVGLPAWGNWAEQGVARNLSSFGSPKEALEKMLFDPGMKQEYLKAREAFIKKHYFRLDGKATERICDVGERYLKKRNEPKEKDSGADKCAA